MITVIRDVFRILRKGYRSPVSICEELDYLYPIPRPASAPFLPAYQAVLALVSIYTHMGVLISCGLIAAACWPFAAWCLGYSLFSLNDYGCASWLVSLFSFVIAYAEAKQLPLAYQRSAQRTTYGTSNYAEANLLEDRGLLKPLKAELEPGTLAVGRLGDKQFVLPYSVASCHTVVFGPPGSGKSASIFLWMIRHWVKSGGSALIFDPKDDVTSLYWQTAHLFKHVYRFNLVNTLESDHWNFIPDCQDTEMADKVAATILQIDATKKSGGQDPFWPKAQMLALQAILMYLSTVTQPNGDPLSPPDIVRLIANPETFATPEQVAAAQKEMADKPGIGRSEKVTILNMLLTGVEGEIGKKIRESWGAFTTIKQEGVANVLIGIATDCRSFTVNAARDLAQPIGVEKRNARWISFKDLRRPGTALYLTVREGDADRYETVLATFLGMAMQALKETTPADGGARVLCLFDEAGNVPLTGLKQMVGVGRGRDLPMVLCYQNLAQVYDQYGQEGGDAIIGSVGSIITLPGLDSRTAEYISNKIGDSTVWSHTSVDQLHGHQGDNERSSEAQRKLITPDEVRRMRRYQTMLVIVSDAPPAKISFPPMSQDRSLLRYQVPDVVNHRRNPNDAATASFGDAGGVVAEDYTQDDHVVGADGDKPKDFSYSTEVPDFGAFLDSFEGEGGAKKGDLTDAAVEELLGPPEVKEPAAKAVYASPFADDAFDLEYAGEDEV